MKSISYKEASDTLGLAVSTIKQAVGRDVLTPINIRGQVKYLYSEQVELFKGKRLTVHALNSSERAKWEELKQKALHPEPEQTVLTPKTEEDLLAKLSTTIDEKFTTFGEILSSVFSKQPLERGHL